MDILGIERDLNGAVAKVLYLRKAEVGQTLEQIAELTGMSRETVNRSLRGKREMGITEVVELARALNMSATDVFDAAKERIQNKSR